MDRASDFAALFADDDRTRRNRGQGQPLTCKAKGQVEKRKDILMLMVCKITEFAHTLLLLFGRDVHPQEHESILYPPLAESPFI